MTLHSALAFLRDRPKTIVVFVLLGVIVFLTSSAILTAPPEPYRFNYPPGFGNRTFIPNNNPTTKQGVYLGRILFYETALSSTNTVSCGSCHRQELAFTDGKKFSDGVGPVPTRRNAMPLANLLWSSRFFWDGRAATLEEQASGPLADPHEMAQSPDLSAKKLLERPGYPQLFEAAFGDKRITGDRIIKAIAQFERTLISANSKYDRYLRNAYSPSAEELAGMKLFNTVPDAVKGVRGANCARCHGGVKTYMELFHNNGLDSLPNDRGIAELTGLDGDIGRFKAPTLRNIALTAPYMHDGRFNTLEEVVDHYSEHIVGSASLSSILRNESNEKGLSSLKLSPGEKKELIAFLHLLTDSSFTRNPEFSNPNLHTAKEQNTHDQ